MRRETSWGPAQQYTTLIRAGNIILSGAAEALRSMLIERIGDGYFVSRRRGESANASIFTRKVGHTQRGGRPVLFDRFMLHSWVAKL